ncbi:MAG: iron chaperone [Marmoricola sp.]
MTAAEIDLYLDHIEEPKRSTLEALRRSILDVIPDAEECISYGMPGFRVDGKVVAGFAAFKNHLAYLPHSGEVLSILSDQLEGYDRTSGSLHFPIDQPLPDDLVRILVETKMALLGL